MKTLVEIPRHRAQTAPDAKAYVFLEDGDEREVVLTHGELDRRARAIGAALQEVAERGDRAVLLFPPDLEYVAAFFGCLYGGVVAVPAYPPDPSRLARTLPRLQAIIADSGASLVLTTSAILAMAELLFAQAPDLQGKRWLATDVLAQGAADTWRDPGVTTESVAFLQYTSGSTGAPKGVVLTHGNLLHNLELISGAFEIDEASVGVSWLPPYHDMGLIGGILAPLYKGRPTALMSPIAFLQQPSRWLKAITRYRATISGGPNFAYELCIRKTPPEVLETLDLTSWTVAFTGAEPVRAETLERFVATFGARGFRRETFYPCYGLAEATLIVSGTSKSIAPIVRTLDGNALGADRAIDTTPDKRDARALVGCGTALGEQRVVIVRPEDGTPCSGGEVGEIWVSGPSVANGYWQRTEETKETFHARVDGSGPFLRTGDLGFIDDGELFITGRLKDLIIIRGRNHYPQDIEHTAEESHPALRRGCCAAFSVDVRGTERLIIAIEVERRRSDRRRSPSQPPGGERRNIDRRQPGMDRGFIEEPAPLDPDAICDSVRKNVMEQHDLHAHDIVLVKPGNIPKTSSGKVQRNACRASYLEGSLEEVAASVVAAEKPPVSSDHFGAGFRAAVLAMRPAARALALEGFLRDCVARVLDTTPAHIDPRRKINTLGLDSLMAVELTHELERTLGIVLSVTSFLRDSSIRLLAEQVLDELMSASGERKSIVPAGDSGHICRLSHGQAALWFVHELAPQSAAYNLCFAARIRTPLDVDALRASLQALVDRHPVLRTTYVASSGRPMQIVHDETTREASARETSTPNDVTRVQLVLVDAADDNERELERRIAEAANAPFNLESGPVVRFHLYRCGQDDQVLLMAVHHIAADFWSLVVLMSELRLLYPVAVLYPREDPSSRAPLPPLELRYRDAIRWQTDLLKGPEGDRLWDYWRTKLGAPLPILDLPTDRPRPPVQSYRGASHAFDLDGQTFDSVRALARASGATPFMVLLAVFNVLLGRYSAQDDLLVGSPVAGRSRAGFERLVGYFVNPLALRTDLSGVPTFRELLARVRATVLEALEHQDYPFSLLVEKLSPARDPSRSPIFQVMFAYEKPHIDRQETIWRIVLGDRNVGTELGGIWLESCPVRESSAQFDLSLMVVESGGKVSAAFQYATDLFDAATIERMAGHFRVLVETVVASPDRGIDGLDMLTEAESRQLLTEWNPTHLPWATDVCLHELFEAQVRRTPDALAIASGHDCLTYRGLDARANRLARTLRRLGVGPESTVGVFVERTADMAVALLAVLKAGGAYVPLDPAYPRERLRFTLVDAAPRVVLAHERLLSRLPQYDGEVVRLDSAADAVPLDAQPDTHLTTTTVPSNLAYLIYTSGSTGRPKGVAIEHRSAVALVRWACEMYSRSELEIVLASTSLCFDLSVFELFVPLSAGGSVVIARDALEAHALDATLINTVPSAVTELLRNGGLPSSLRCLNLAGEPLAVPLASSLREAHEGVRVFNLYGPSEDTTYSTSAQIVDSDVTIGRPLAGKRAYVLDTNLRPTPIGVPSELYLAGAGLARGYFDRADLTASCFVPNPFGEAASSRLYRTGDCVRYRADGRLEFHGRFDHQVKVRGFRIELGEVEAALVQQSVVREAVCVVREDVPGDRRLVAYVSLQSGASEANTDLRARLAEMLPGHMVPSAIVELDALPLTPSGKIDRRALPAPGARAVLSTYVAPRGRIEEAVAQAFSEVLRIDRVGVHDDFFELGGHSLLATQVVSRLRATFGVELPLRSIFEAPSVELLAQRLRWSSPPGRVSDLPPPLVRGGDDAERLLSFGQERLWFLDQLKPGSPFYNIPGAVQLTGPLDTDALERSLREVVRRHEVLRTTFAEAVGRPEPVVHDEVSLPFAYVDLRWLAPAQRDEAIRSEALREARWPFDLARGPLIRAALLELARDEHVLLVTMHHVVSDGWSVGVLVNEIAALYRAFALGAPSPLPELSIQYADCARFQRRWVRGNMLARQLAFWKSHLDGAPPALELPTDRPRPGMQTFLGAAVPFELSRDLTESLVALGRQEGATLFMTLLAAFNLLLSRYSGQRDIVVGTPIANRTRSETEPLIGFFVNTLALRTVLSGGPTFRELVARERATALGAYAHQHVPFERIVEELAPERDLSRSPLFQVMFTLQNTPDASLDLGALRITALELDAGISKFDLSLVMVERHGRLIGSFEYATDLFDASTIERMAAHFRTLLESAVASPAIGVDGLSMLGEGESQRLLVEWNATAATYPTETCIHELFEERAAHAPDATALFFGEAHVSYAELDRRANRLAHRLGSAGISVESYVGVCMRRSVETIVAMLGILKCGAAFVPLDPSYPSDRLEDMAHDASLDAVVTLEGVGGAQFSNVPVIVRMDSEAERLAAESSNRPNVRALASAAAYVIFTSGSTGRPKGVVGLHRNTMNRLRWMWKTFPFEANEVACHKTSLNFVDSIWEIFGALLQGVPTVIVDDDTLRAPDELVALLGRHDVTRIVLVPSLLRVIVDGVCELSTQARSLRYWSTSGEAVTADLVDALHSCLPGAKLLNLYGSSEAAADSTFYEPPRAAGRDPVPIGRPIANTQTYVLDRDLRPVPIGVVGELWIGGDGLSRGYVGRGDLTAERFVPAPFGTQAGAVMYRSGDRVRWRHDGELEYIGRVDHQVKIRGHRIELAEIEAVLKRDQRVRQAVCFVREDVPGDRRLVAYVVTNPANDAIDAELHAQLKSRLPDYMLPTAIVILDELPLTPSGKIDRIALPAPDARAGVTLDYTQPRSPIEEAIAAAFSEVLRAAKVGVHDDFFELGGHSLLATQVVSRLRAAFGVELPLRKLFEAPTVAALAECVQSALGAGEQSDIPPLVRGGADAERVLSFGQERLWFLDQLDPGSPSYNIPAAVRLTGPLDVGALERSLPEVVRRHEVLRTTFGDAHGRPVPVVHDEGSLLLARIDLRALASAERDEAVHAEAVREARAPFDLARGPLVRATLLELATDEHVLLVTMHHAVSDGWSVGVLVNEVVAIYRAFATGAPPLLPELPIQYTDYARFQRAWLQGNALERQLAFWRRRLEGAAPALDLPTDRPRPLAQSFRGATLPFELPAELTQALIALGRREGATLFMTLLAAFNVLLSRYSGQRDVVVGTPIANRTRKEAEPLIGFFVNTLALRTDLSGRPTFRELLERVRETALGAFTHQHVPFERVVEELAPERDLGRSPLFQVMFLLRGDPTASIDLGGLQVAALELDVGIAKFDLSLLMTEQGGRLVGSFEYATDLFDASTVERMAEHFCTLLEAAVHDTDRPIAQLAVLEGDQRHEALEGWNDTLVPFPTDVCLSELFEAQAKRSPDAAAVVFEECVLSYRDLDARADAFAGRLSSLGVGPDVLVAVCMQRSLDLVVALLAISKAGGAYVPIDPDLPPERVTTMLDVARCNVIVADAALENGLQRPGSVVVSVHAPEGAVLRDAGARGSRRTPMECAAYVLFTSGSTGRPKGVVITHRAIVNHMHWMLRAFPMGPADAVLQKTPLGFDASVWEFFAPLLTGGRLVLAAPGLHRDAESLPKAVVLGGITTLQVVPSLLRAMLDVGDFARGSSLRRLFCGGEALSRELVDRVLQHGPVDVVNLYGPTEACIDALSHTCDRGRPGAVPIGRPIDNVRAYVLDAEGEPVPVGVVGEVYLAGVGLARSYLNRPDLTADHFVPDPFGPEAGGRSYRTGDLARYLPDGEIVYVGRRDHQVKVRGHRIELGEIEATLERDERVRQSVCVVREDVPGDRRLVAYVVTNPAEGGLDAEFRGQLRLELPDYMVPTAIVVLDALPLTPNGKIDRKSLPAPDVRAGAAAHTPPRNPIEEAIAAAFAEVLRIELVGVHDDFFELGGHSLLATQLVSRIRSRFHIELPLRTIFELRTVERLAAAIDVAQDENTRTAPSSIVRVSREARRMKKSSEGLSVFLDSPDEPSRKRS